MGSCIAKKIQVHSSPSTPAGGCKTIDDLKECLVYHIVRMHHLILNCRKGVEDCLISKNKDSATLIRSKELVIRKKSEQLQALVKEIDELIDFKIRNKKIIKRVLQEGGIRLKEMSESIYLDDISEIMNSNLDYNELVKSELKNYEINDKTVEIQIEKEFQKRKSLENGGYIRRRYSKELTYQSN